MHGMIHLQLQRFVEHHHGADAWRELAKRAGVQDEIYTPLQGYPDEHVVRLVKAASEMTGTDAQVLLHAFGEFLVPTYLGVYGRFLRSSWRTLELLENTEATIHRVVRVRQPGAEPPFLRVARDSIDQVTITYTSRRRLCAVARGIVSGVAKHFGEAIELSELQCMLKGDSRCSIEVRHAGAQSVKTRRSTLRPG